MRFIPSKGRRTCTTDGILRPGFTRRTVAGRSVAGVYEFGLRRFAKAHCVLLAILFTLALSLPAQAQKTPSFRALADFSGDFHYYSRAEGVSGDGRVVVGTNLRGAFRWTEAEGAVSLQAGPSGRAPVRAYDASFDGSVIVGTQAIPSVGSVAEPFRWTEETGALGLGYFIGVIYSNRALGTSASGDFVVGVGGFGAFQWTESGGLLPLGGRMPPFGTNAYAVSADGSVVVGAMGTDAGLEAYRWTEDTGYVGLGDLPGGDFRSQALAVSADGSVIVGWSESLTPDGESRQQPFRWTKEDGMVGLGFLPTISGTFGHSEATAVSADGSVIVGDSSGAFIWDTVHGLRDLEEVLRNDYGLATEMEGWILSEATGISDDGTVIVGVGINLPFTTDIALDREGWVAVIPEPASVTLCVIGAILLIGHRLASRRRLSAD